MKLDYFLNADNFYSGLKTLFNALNIPVNYIAEESIAPADLLAHTFKANNPAHQLMDDVFILGMVDDAAFKGKKSVEVEKIKADYEGILIFGVTLKKRDKDLLPTRSQLAEITRAFNREFHYTPVIVVFKYEGFITIANAERLKFKQEWREGEKNGKVTMLKDVDIRRPHTAHLKILDGLTIDPDKTNSFQKLYKYWHQAFSIQALNDQFYSDLQGWFYFAIRSIKLPFRPDYIPEKENVKNFLVRLLARTMFCWFVKEKGLIKNELLELCDWEGSRYPLTSDIENSDFLNRNSYYRGILQNVFFNALNRKEKSGIKDFKWTKYVSKDFNYDWLCSIPYLNGGIFDKLEEDNAKESIEDSVIKIPNFLFYGIPETLEEKERKGLNGIFKAYKFTLEENTPFEEDIALDPELLGLVFENLLAELDPNLEESTIKSIRKLTGSYYTPRKIIQEMVNESLFLYLAKFLETNNPDLKHDRKLLSGLVYHNTLPEAGNGFCSAVVHALDKFKVLDPACGSGAFPMGMLHRIVDILKLVDPENELWLELKLKSVDSAQRAEFKKLLSKHVDDYGRKLGIIRDSIYGIDIQPLAVQITKLRFFISLLIDQRTDKGITPMPNIETKIICANSLKNIQPDLFSYHGIPTLTEARNRYYQPEITHDERAKITVEIVDILNDAFPFFAREITGKTIKGQNKALLREWFNHATIASPFFNMDFFFPELKEFGGFDCVIGNPPYGGTAISDEVRSELGVESKDPYGAFIARFLNSAGKTTPLKHGGVLAFIVSDTFMTIKSHFKLREMMMQNYIHKMLRVNKDTFHATVNTAIIICERNEYSRDENNKPITTFNEHHICQMADMTNISIHDNYDHFIEVLEQTKGIDFKETDTRKSISNAEYAIYYYPQSLIATNSNLPFFVASPKLFALMNDNGKDLKKEIREINGENVIIRKIEMNGEKIDIVKLGDIADVKVGLQTGDNEAYLFQNPEARGTYRSIEEYKDYLLNDIDLETIRNNNELRLKIIDKGISKENIKSESYFGGRYIVPYDKGGESDAEDGWMPNYFVPTNYFIDWSEWAIKRMKTLTTFERNRLEGKAGGNHQLCSRFQNADTYFQKGISFSDSGEYSPTYRLNFSSVFDQKGSTIISIIDGEVLLGFLSSKLCRFLIRVFINHTISSHVDCQKELVIIESVEFKIKKLVEIIITTQESNPRYDYASHEQIEIDRLVYEAYGLNAEDIEEVENWYARRYPKLSAAQKANLRKLGKSDDYLELYGLK